MGFIPSIAADSAEWHAMRAKNIGASEVAALFNLSPFMTKYELWYLKKGTLRSDYAENKRTRYGRKLEAVIAEGVAEETGWQVSEINGYYRHEAVAGMGATPDRMIAAPDQDGYGALEIKNVDWLQYKREWSDGVPIYYLLQLQHQLACTGWKWGCVAPLVGGNDIKRHIIQRHKGAIAKIESAVTAFWESIAANEPPKPVEDADYDVVRKIYQTADSAEVDLNGDNELPDLCAELLTISAQRKDAEKKEGAIKAQIFEKIKTAPVALCGDYIIKAPEIIKNMPAKAAHIQKYRTLTVKEKTNG